MTESPLKARQTLPDFTHNCQLVSPFPSSGEELNTENVERYTGYGSQLDKGVSPAHSSNWLWLPSNTHWLDCSFLKNYYYQCLYWKDTVKRGRQTRGHGKSSLGRIETQDLCQRCQISYMRPA